MDEVTPAKEEPEATVGDLVMWADMVERDTVWFGLATWLRAEAARRENEANTQAMLAHPDILSFTPARRALPQGGEAELREAIAVIRKAWAEPGYRPGGVSHYQLGIVLDAAERSMEKP